MSTAWIDNKCYVDEPVNQLLGKPNRKPFEFESTEVVVEASMPKTAMPMMPAMQGQAIPTVDPLAGYNGTKKPVEKIPVKAAGQGRSK